MVPYLHMDHGSLLFAPEPLLLGRLPLMLQHHHVHFQCCHKGIGRQFCRKRMSCGRRRPILSQENHLRGGVLCCYRWFSWVGESSFVSRRSVKSETYQIDKHFPFVYHGASDTYSFLLPVACHNFVRRIVEWFPVAFTILNSQQFFTQTDCCPKLESTVYTAIQLVPRWRRDRFMPLPKALV